MWGDMGRCGEMWGDLTSSKEHEEVRYGEIWEIWGVVGRSDLEEGARGGELLDRVAAVHQQALRAVDEGDGALTRRGGREAGVVREEARLCVERSHVDHRVAEPRVWVQDLARGAVRRKGSTRLRTQTWAVQRRKLDGVVA